MQVLQSEASFGWIPVQGMWEYWAGVLTPFQHLITPGLLVVIVLLLLTEIFVSRKREKDQRGWWRSQMATLWGSRPKLTLKQRKAFLDQFREDGIVEFVEAGVYEGKITREEAKCIYAHFVDYCGLKGLMPRTDQARLKRELQDKHPPAPKAQTEIGSAFLKALKS